MKWALRGPMIADVVPAGANAAVIAIEAQRFAFRDGMFGFMGDTNRGRAGAGLKARNPTGIDLRAIYTRSHQQHAQPECMGGFRGGEGVNEKNHGKRTDSTTPAAPTARAAAL